MKWLLTFLFLVYYSVLSQDIQFGGTYIYGTTPDLGRTGVIYIYPNSDSTFLFYLELNRGAPSFNSGAIVGQMNLSNSDEAEFTMIKENDYINCSMKFTFTKDSLFIRTLNEADECGYGYAVYSYGDFRKTKNKVPDFFIDRRNKKTWFKNLDWKKWWDWN